MPRARPSIVDSGTMKDAVRAGVVLTILLVAGAILAGQRPETGATPENLSRQSAAGAAADRFVTVNGMRIHYVDWGNPGAPPLILIHGLDRVARTCDHVAPHFTSRFHVIAMDMRGHGDSGWDPEGRYLVEHHVGDVEGLVQQLGLKNITIWGNSDRKSTRLNSSHSQISYAVFCL